MFKMFLGAVSVNFLESLVIFPKIYIKYYPMTSYLEKYNMNEKFANTTK